MREPSVDTTLLLQRWQAGERAALDQLLEAHLDWIKAELDRRLGPRLRQKAETGDYVQETIVEFLRYGPRFTLSNGRQFRALLAKIAENVLRGNHDWWRAQRRDLARERPLAMDSSLDLDPAATVSGSPSQVAIRDEREAWIRLGLELLRAPDREVIVLRDYRGRSFPDIGAQLGKSEIAARQRYLRAVDRLSATVAALRRRDLTSVLDDAGEQVA